MRYWQFGLAALVAIGAAQVAAQSPAPAAARAPIVLPHPWVAPPPDTHPQAYFLDLKDGDRIETPFILRFGLSMRGLAPAEIPAGSAGHHHLLIDYPIPQNQKMPLPFTDNYIHFGKGEMQTILQLKPGTYQLALLLADEDHVPQAVYSKPIRVTVTKRDPSVNVWKLWGTPRIEIRNPADGEAVHGPFRVNFHASAFNVASTAARVKDAGHFRLNIDRPGKPPEVLDFDAGQTEVWLKPPQGDYTLRLELLSNVKPGEVLTTAKPVRIKVSAAK